MRPENLRPHKAQKITIKATELREYYAEFMETLHEENKAKNTIDQYATSLDTFFNYLELKEIKDVTQQTINGYVDYLKNDFKIITYKKHTKTSKKAGTVKGRIRHDENGAPIVDKVRGLEISTINTRITVLKRFFNWIGLKGFKLDKLNHVKTFDNPLTLKDYENLLEWCDILTDPTERNKTRKRKLRPVDCRREKLIMQIFKETGIRFSELNAFTIQSLKGAKRHKERNEAGKMQTFFIIQVTNKGKTRDIFIPEFLYKKILEYAKEQKREPEELIFCKPSDHYALINKSGLWKKLKYIARKSNVKQIDGKIHAHSFRHLFATEHYKRHKNLPALQTILGHSNMETTAIYINLTTSDIIKTLI